MPAAAVIPAPIAYIEVVAVKKLVVGLFFGCECIVGIKLLAMHDQSFTVKKLECLKQGYILLNILAWNNDIRLVRILLVCVCK